MSTDVVQETKLFKMFIEKANEEDITTIKNACGSAEDLLEKIPDTFPTYTLHNATHSKNICDIMSGLLGAHDKNLTVLETAYLILAAFYHDSGMVYFPEERERLLCDEDFNAFQKEYPQANQKIQANGGAVPEDVAEWFYRSIHHRHTHHIPDLTIKKTPLRDKLAVLCQSHGENLDYIFSHASPLSTETPEIADLRFCAILLRIADILDFDYTRSPNVLYEYLCLKDADSMRLKKSKAEFIKHGAALGFDFSCSRAVGWKLPFKASCDEFDVEHDIRTFLDRIEQEIEQCRKELKNCDDRWKDFGLPVGISREGIQSNGYKYGEYRFTLEQNQALELFTGENLYPDKTVFVRELLQNSIDAVLHRKAKAWYSRTTYKPQIDITAWTDDKGRQWLRVDDNGTGMNERKILDYFLRVGKSYYSSDEFLYERSRWSEVPDDGANFPDFYPISRFGIGVLSCFLAGDRVEVSTRHCGEDSDDAIRMSMNGTTGYFKLQSKRKVGLNNASPMPSRNGKGFGYRPKAGTSIAVCVNPHKHFAILNFEEIIKKYLVYPPVPVNFNGLQIVPTEENLLAEVNRTQPTIVSIPQEFIAKVKAEYSVEIDPESTVEISFNDISPFVTAPNKGNLKGAFYAVTPKLKFQGWFGALQRQDGFIVDVDREGERLAIILDISKVQSSIHHEVKYILSRIAESGYSKEEIEEMCKKGCGISSLFKRYKDLEFPTNPIKTAIPQKLVRNHIEQCIYLVERQKLLSKRESSHVPAKEIRRYCCFDYADTALGRADGIVDIVELCHLTSIPWYAHHILPIWDRPNHIISRPIESYMNRYSYSYNGIGINKIGEHTYKSPLFIPIILFRDAFQPKFNLARDSVKNLPLEMISEIDLCFRKIHKHFDIKESRTRFSGGSLLDDKSSYGFFCSDDSFYTYKEWVSLQNFACEGGWGAYLECEEWGPERQIEQGRLARINIKQQVVFSWLQTHCRVLYEHSDEHRNCLMVINNQPERDDIIEQYYPPLFFVEMDSALSDLKPKKPYDLNRSHEDALQFFVETYSLNRNHEDAQWLIDHTKHLHDEYPALFFALVTKVIYNSSREEPDFYELMKKIKSLPLKRNEEC